MYSTPNAKEIGKKLKELRGNMKLEVAAKGIGITSTSLCNYESGTRIPRDEAKSKIANFYNVSVGVLFFNESTHEL